MSGEANICMYCGVSYPATLFHACAKPEKPRIAVHHHLVEDMGDDLGDRAPYVGVCSFCQALIWPGKESARLHVERMHGGELAT